MCFCDEVQCKTEGGICKTYLVINCSISSCRWNPYLFEEFVTHWILNVLTWIKKIAKDHPEIQVPPNWVTEIKQFAAGIVSTGNTI